MSYATVLTLLAALLHTSAFDAIDKRSADDASSLRCRYSFNVPAEDGETCPPALNLGNLTALEVAISTQHADLEAKLNAILARLQLEDSSSTEEDTLCSDSCDRDGGGVNYKQWGRTTCPTTATLVYAGECVHVPV